MKSLVNICETVNNIIWSDATVIFLLVVGIFFTASTGFFQFTHFRSILKNTAGSLFKKNNKKGGITPFQAVSTALGGTIGTGNIAGVATAITAGGPGAVFWMWVSGLLGMMTKYAEVVLAVHFRKPVSGGFVGGPMYYIEKGLSSKFFASVFAVLCIFASFGTGNMSQSNSIAMAAEAAFSVSPQLTGIFICIICTPVIMGGVRKIARFSEIVVPFMAFFYMSGAIIFLIINYGLVPGALKLIFVSALNPRSAFGGFAGAAVKYGIARGIFTNEAGMGSAPIAHGCADTESPVKQGMWGIFEVFFDTIVICTMTALVILTAGGGNYYLCGEDGAALTAGAFSTVYGSFGSSFISVAIVFFALASIAGWAFYGQKALEYITPHKIVHTLYKIVFIILIFAGAVMPIKSVWCISDTLNGLMMLPNLAAVLLLSPTVVRLTKNKY